MKSYRAIYKEHHGPIPKDETGRTFEIHHIDGDRSNNSIENLKCVSIKEHYEIHLLQGDYAAASYIAGRMDIKPEDSFAIRSKASSEINKRLIADGRHPSQNPEVLEKMSLKAIKENQRRVKEGTHNLLGPKNNKKRLDEGNHNWQLAKNTIPCYDKLGNYVRIPKEVFWAQTGPKDQWDYVHNTSNEGKRRKLLIEQF